MTLSSFESWLMLGVISMLVLVVGYFIRRDVLEKRRQQEEPYRPEGDFEKSFWKLLMEKIDKLSSDVGALSANMSEVKTYIGVQNERNLNVHDKITVINDRLDSHAERISKLEKDHSKNHDR